MSLEALEQTLDVASLDLNATIINLNPAAG
jgi:hypothetical protein